MSNDWPVYKLQRDGRTVYCNSAAAVVFLAMGWRLSDPTDRRAHENLAVALAASMREVWRRSR